MVFFQQQASALRTTLITSQSTTRKSCRVHHHYPPSFRLDRLSVLDKNPRCCFFTSAGTFNSATKLFSASTNREIAEKRQQVYQAKREARQVSIDLVNERNFQLKRLLHSNGTEWGAFCVPPLYQIKVTVCEELRQDLKLSGREKRGRLFLEQDSAAVSSLAALRSELHAFFRALRKGTYVLSAGYPSISDETIIAAPSDISVGNASDDDELLWPVQTDEDVVRTFQKTDDFFATATTALKRPTVVLHVQKDPFAPPPPPPPAYLDNLPDPTKSTHMTMLSFYSFPATGIADPDVYATTLRKLWKPFAALGRIYVATEGINAQMSVPTNVLSNFVECCDRLPENVGLYLRDNGGINVDPVPLTRDEFAVAGTTAAGGRPAPPFSNLHIRVRQQVVADGLNRAYDWQNAGTYTCGRISFCMPLHLTFLPTILIIVTHAFAPYSFPLLRDGRIRHARTRMASKAKG